VLCALQVREHHRKVRMEEKDKIKKGGGTLEYRKKKDPGIPNAWSVARCVCFVWGRGRD